jgi:hypothetical protein
MMPMVMGLWCGTASADFTCDLDLNYGVVVNDDQIRIVEESQTVVQINHQGQLFIEGRWLKLTPQQQEHLQHYAKNLHDIVPQITLLATEGVNIAIDTVERVYKGLVGTDSDDYAKLKRSMDKVRSQVRDNFKYATDHYYMGPGSAGNVDDLANTGLTAQLGDSFNTSLGGILSAIGSFGQENSNPPSIEMTALTDQLQVLSGESGMGTPPAVNLLLQKAQSYCQSLILLDEEEDALRVYIPELAPYDVIHKE